VQRRVVEKHAVRVLAVVAERFAVIGGDDDEGVGSGGLDEAADCAIHGRDLAVVRRRGIPSLQRAWRIVGIMRIEEMNPEKKRRPVCGGCTGCGGWGGCGG
jgi:hypothetical protein